MGFAQFLKQFATGSYRFTPKDFPGQEGMLEQQNIKYIELTYTIDGGSDVVQLLNKSPGRIPEEIIDPDRQISAKRSPEIIQPKPMEPEQHEVPVEPGKSDKTAELEKSPKKQEPVLLTKKVNKIKKPSSSSEGEDKGYYDEQWIKSQPEGKFTLQIMSLSSADGVRKGLQLLKEDEIKLVYVKKIDGNSWYILCTGIYDSREEAEQSIDSLPAPFRESKPIIRTFKGIQDDIKADAI